MVTCVSSAHSRYVDDFDAKSQGRRLGRSEYRWMVKWRHSKRSERLCVTQ